MIFALLRPAFRDFIRISGGFCLDVHYFFWLMPLSGFNVLPVVASLEAESVGVCLDTSRHYCHFPGSFTAGCLEEWCGPRVLYLELRWCGEMISTRFWKDIVPRAMEETGVFGLLLPSLLPVM